VPLPDTIRVKISSEAAGYAAMSPVVVQDIELSQLITYVVAAAGPDPAGVSSMLARGVVVSGASRFRWQGFAADARELEALLCRLPSDDPSRPFDASLCLRITFVSQARRFQLPRELAMRKRLFREPFWTSFLSVLPAPSYVRYLHSESADLYSLAILPPVAGSLHRLAPLLPGRGAARLLASHPFTSIEFLASR
jgi:hypothetical protein